MDASETVLDIASVSITYGQIPVLNSVSFAVKAGETFGLIGLNGAGKTSLLKSIIGLRPPDSGSVALFGKPPSDKAARLRFTFLPERFEPAWFLTGYEFVEFSLRLYGHHADRAAIEDNARGLELDPRALGRRVQTYSKGMRQKLGLIGVVMTGCDLLILDEPMSGLDPLARKHVKDMLLACKAQGRGIFLSSHILADMDEICDRVAVLHHGDIKFIGVPEKLKQLTSCANLEHAFLQYIEKREAA